MRLYPGETIHQITVFKKKKEKKKEVFSTTKILKGKKRKDSQVTDCRIQWWQNCFEGEK